MTTKNLINYTIYTTTTPDKDGDYILTFKINWQEPKQVWTHMVDMEYKAKNGYTIRSGIWVNINKTKKEIFLLGTTEYWTRTVMLGKTIPANINYEIFSSTEEMEKCKQDIIEAIADWAENGGFDSSHIVEENFSC